MFEKEAKERAKDYTENKERQVSYECGFLDGAEFGYNKAKVEVEESYRESLCNSELNLASVTEQLEELEKANEWHYVKDGDLPSDKHGHVVINQDFDKVTIRNGRFESLDGCKADVIAWKEIVFPKE